jgi:LysR family transcriptional regulator, glycine cleavage system transcriptional activator
LRQYHFDLRLSFTYAIAMSSLLPSLNWLRVFEAAARHSSFARAGRELNMSAAAVSQQISALETSLGRGLFDRAANGVTLTAEGGDFLPTVQVALASVEGKASALFSRPKIVPVTLFASQLMAMSWLPKVLADFERDNPSHRVDLIMEGSQRRVTPDLSIRFGEEPLLARHPGWLMGLSHVVMCRAQDLPGLRGIDDLLAHRLFDVASHAIGWSAFLHRSLGPMHGYRPRIEPVDTTPLALMMVSQGLGLAIGHLPVCAPMAAALNLAICPLLPPIAGPGNYYLEHASDRPLRPEVQRVAGALQAKASQ